VIGARYDDSRRTSSRSHRVDGGVLTEASLPSRAAAGFQSSSAATAARLTAGDDDVRLRKRSSTSRKCPTWSRAVSAWVRQLPLFASIHGGEGPRSKATRRGSECRLARPIVCIYHVEKCSAAEVYRHLLAVLIAERIFAAALQHLLDAPRPERC